MAPAASSSRRISTHSFASFSSVTSLPSRTTRRPILLNEFGVFYYAPAGFASLCLAAANFDEYVFLAVKRIALTSVLHTTRYSLPLVAQQVDMQSSQPSITRPAPSPAPIDDSSTTNPTTTAQPASFALPPYTTDHHATNRL
eukprot:6187823-Pleurochrysis_carterae.AAC.5